MEQYTRINEYSEWVEATKQRFAYCQTLHDLGHGHKEVLIRRLQVRKDMRGILPYSQRPQSEKDELNIARAARRAKSNIRRRVKAMQCNSLLTLTYRENMQDEELCKMHLKEFVRRMRKLIPDFVYVAGYEKQSRGAWHVHMAVQQVQSHFMQQGVRVKSFNVIRAVWRSVVGELGGNIDLQRKKKNSKKTIAQLASYISKYMTKAFAEGEKYSQRWTASRFKMPKPQTKYWLHNCNMADLIQEAVAEFAPQGTQIRCTFIDDNRGFFFTVEPTS